MNFFDYITQLENELNERKGLFKKVDVDKIASIVTEMKAAYPEALKEAEYVNANKQKVLETADTTAKKILMEAELRAREMLSESEIIKKAREEAKAAVDAAIMQCRSVTDDVHQHLDGVFAEVEEFLLNTSRMINNNRAELERALKMNLK